MTGLIWYGDPNPPFVVLSNTFVDEAEVSSDAGRVDKNC